ncbi:MAG: hypothetical protein AVO34_00370 [Firmicutes bacterium ML8_F2]|nr:MAG: hypothetical protein AVO34_00370 [Firmicutes bacterium ML8_F2]
MSGQWYFSRSGEKQGPYSWEEILYFYHTGNIRDDDYLWSSELGSWQRANRIPELTGSNVPPAPDYNPVESNNTGQAEEVPKKNSLLIIGLIGGGVIMLAALLFIVVTFLDLPFLSFGGRDKVLISTTVEPSEEEQIFGREGSVMVKIPGDMLEEPTDLNVTFLGDYETRPADAELEEVYKITLGDYQELPGVLEIEMPYELSDIPQGESAEYYYGALYYNEESGTWDQVVHDLDPAKNVLTLYTYHLTDFAKVKRSSSDPDSPMAMVSRPIFLPASVYSLETDEVAELLSEMGSGGTPGDGAVKMGWDSATEMFGIIGTGSTFLEEVLAVSTLNSINSAMGEMGLGLAFVNLAINLDQDNTAPAVLGFTKDLGNYALGKWGTSAMKIASVGVFAIDYSLNKFATTAIAGREQMYVDAYKKYYYRNSKYSTLPGFKVKNNVGWYKTFYWITKDSSSPAEAEKKIAEAIDSYVYAFWNDPQGMSFVFGDMGQGFSYSGGDNPPLEKSIAENHKAELVNSLQPVFRRLARQIRYERTESFYNNEARRITRMLNSVYKIRVRVVVPEEMEESEAPIKIEELPVAIDMGRNQDLWSGFTDEDGIWEMQCTLLGLMNAEPSGKVVLSGLGPDGEDEMEVDLKLPDPGGVVEVVFDMEAPELAGRWEGNWMLTYSAFLEMDSPNPSPEAEEAVDGCEENLGEAMFQMMIEAIKELMQTLLDNDVPMVLEFKETETENFYTGSALIQFDAVLPEENAAEASEDHYIEAVYENGTVRFSFSDEGLEMIFTGQPSGQDTLSGTFSVPAGNNKPDVMSGVWRVQRVSP